MHARVVERSIRNNSQGCSARVGLRLAAVIVLVACSAGEEARPRPDNMGSGGAEQGGAGLGGSGHGGSGQGGAASAQGGAATGAGGMSGGAPGSGGAASGGVNAKGGAASGGASSGGSAQTGGAQTSMGGASKGGASSGGGGNAGAGGKSNSGGSSAGGSSAGTSGASTSAGSGGGSATCAGFALCDDFEDGNFTANPAWIATPSAFNVTSDGSKVLTQQASSEAWAYAGNIGWTDVTIQARVKVTNFGGTSSSYCGGLIARWQGSSNPNYQANLCANGTVGIYKDGGLVDETNGTKNVGIVANTWYTLKFKVAGAPGKVALTLTINDMQAISITDSDTSASVSSGYVGLGTKKTLTIEYDDIKVSTP